MVTENQFFCIFLEQYNFLIRWVLLGINLQVQPHAGHVQSSKFRHFIDLEKLHLQKHISQSANHLITLLVQLDVPEPALLLAN